MKKICAVVCCVCFFAFVRPVSLWAGPNDDSLWLNNRGVAALNEGNFKEAIAYLRRAANLSPQDSFILQNLAMAMNNLAVQHLHDTQLDQAIRWLLDARKLSDDAVIRKNMAQALILKGREEAGAGRPELAQQYFRDAAAADPQSAHAHEWLGRSLYDEGRLKEALVSIEEAYRLEGRDDLKKFADKISREETGESNFFEQNTMHFQVFYSPDIAYGHVSSAVWALERAYQDHRTFLGGAPRTEISAVFYSTKDKFTTTHELTSNVAGIYDGKVRMPIADPPNWDAIGRTLSHEVAHAFLFDMGGADIPLWLNEGLAELLSLGADRPTPSLNQSLKKREPLVQIR